MLTGTHALQVPVGTSDFNGMVTLQTDGASGKDAMNYAATAGLLGSYLPLTGGDLLSSGAAILSLGRSGWAGGSLEIRKESSRGVVFRMPAESITDRFDYFLEYRRLGFDTIGYTNTNPSAASAPTWELYLPSGTTVNDISTTLSAASTDDQLITAKAAWDAIQAGGGGDPPATNTTTVTMTNQVEFPAGISIAGNAITSVDTNGTPAFMMALSTNIVNGVATWNSVLPLDTSVYDTHSGVDLGNNRYTFPKTGYWEVYGFVTFASLASASDRMLCRITLDGGSSAIGANVLGGVTASSAHCYVPLIAITNTSQYVELFPYSQAGGSASAYWSGNSSQLSTRCYLSGIWRRGL